MHSVSYIEERPSLLDNIYDVCTVNYTWNTAWFWTFSKIVKHKLRKVNETQIKMVFKSLKQLWRKNDSGI